MNNQQRRLPRVNQLFPILLLLLFIFFSSIYTSLKNKELNFTLITLENSTLLFIIQLKFV